MRPVPYTGFARRFGCEGSFGPRLCLGTERWLGKLWHLEQLRGPLDVSSKTVRARWCLLVATSVDRGVGTPWLYMVRTAIRSGWAISKPLGGRAHMTTCLPASAAFRERERERREPHGPERDRDGAALALRLLFLQVVLP